MDTRNYLAALLPPLAVAMAATNARDAGGRAIVDVPGRYLHEPSTPRRLALEGPLNAGGPCPVEALRRGSRKTRRQRRKGDR